MPLKHVIVTMMRRQAEATDRCGNQTFVVDSERPDSGEWLAYAILAAGQLAPSGSGVLWLEPNVRTQHNRELAAFCATLHCAAQRGLLRSNE